MNFTGPGITNPELDRFSGDIQEGELFSISGPNGFAGARTGGKRDMNLSPIGDAHQLEARGARCDAVPAWGVVLAVVLWLHACAGEAQERCCHPGNRRVVQDTSRIASCVGLTSGTGGDGASMTSRMSFGGRLYPDALSFDAGGAEVTFEKEELDCAAMRTDVARASSAPSSIKVKVLGVGISFLRFN